MWSSNREYIPMNDFSKGGRKMSNDKNQIDEKEYEKMYECTERQIIEYRRSEKIKGKT